jgi:hypothetical protein
MPRRKSTVFPNQSQKQKDSGTKKLVTIDISELFSDIQQISEKREMTVESIILLFSKFCVKLCKQLDEGKKIIFIDISEFFSDIQSISKNRDTTIDSTLFRFIEFCISLCKSTRKGEQVKFFVRIDDKETEIRIP